MVGKGNYGRIKKILKNYFLVSNYIKISQCILAVALFLCLFSMPYEYYILVRYVAAVVFIVMSCEYYRKNSKGAAVFWLSTAILFQPLLKIPLGRIVWNILDVVIVILLLYIILNNKSRSQKESVIEIVEEINQKLFPEGQEQMNNETRRLSSLLNNRYSLEDVKVAFLHACSIFLLSPDKTQNSVISSIQYHPKNNLDRHSIIIVYQFVAEKFLLRRTENKTGDMQVLLDYVNGNFNTGCTENIIPEGYGPYGLTETNPIPTKGILANESYLSKLRTLKGEKINWKRIGSTNARNIENPIDIYNVTTEKGLDMGCIFISPYQNHTSTESPMGFVHIDSISTTPPYPVCHQLIYNKNLAIDDIVNGKGELLTSTSMEKLIPLLFQLKNDTNEIVEIAKMEYTSLAQKGIAEAYNNLAIICDFHNGGKKEYFKKSANGGCLNAFFNLSLEENEESFNWNKKAIKLIKEPLKEDIETILCINMAIRYHFGLGCAVDVSMAKIFYTKVLSFKSNIAENNMGAILLKEGDKEQAKRLFNRAIEKRKHYRHGLDIYGVTLMAEQNLQII